MCTFWLGELANESLGNFPATPEIDRDLSLRALAARDDAGEAWALFRLLAWKIDRFARRFRYWQLAPWELADVVQETYPVFLKTLELWKPRYVDGQPAGYLFYFLAVYPRWLQNRTRSWLRPGGRTVPFRPEEDTRPAPDESRAVIDDFCAHLKPQQARLLRLRLATDSTIPQAAAELGMSRYRAYRVWHGVVEIGREYMREAG
jgi:DNA-directed RNA polymerase specialized sigma24 family protein